MPGVEREGCVLCLVLNERAVCCVWCCGDCIHFSTVSFVEFIILAFTGHRHLIFFQIRNTIFTLRKRKGRNS